MGASLAGRRDLGIAKARVRGSVDSGRLRAYRVRTTYCATHNWLIGSPDTVTRRLREVYEEVGGFGTILLFCFDYSETPDAWHNSMRLLAEEVMPRVADLKPRAPAGVA